MKDEEAKEVSPIRAR